MCRVPPGLPRHNVKMAREDKNDGRVYLREWREHRGLTLEQLAEKVDASVGQVSMLETGDRGLSARWARKLALALDTAPGNLLDYPPDQSPAKVVNIWSRATPAEREQLEKVAEAMLGYRPG
jgi:transcriptional regulator with XRE-family HTH domain